MPTYTWNTNTGSWIETSHWRHYVFTFTVPAIPGRSWTLVRRNRVPRGLSMKWPAYNHLCIFHLRWKRCPTTFSCCNNCFTGIGEGPVRLCGYRTWKPSYSTIRILPGGIMVGLMSWRGVVSEQWLGKKNDGADTSGRTHGCWSVQARWRNSMAEKEMRMS